MESQRTIATNLYRMFEVYEDPQQIIDTIYQLHNVNRWNLRIRSYEIDDSDIAMWVVDVENPNTTYRMTTMCNRSEPIDYGDSMLTFFLWQIKWDLEIYPMADEIIKALIFQGAKSSPYLYKNWLDMEEYYEDEDTYPMYKNIRYYLGLFSTINRLKNVRNRNKRARTIQRRIRGNRSRLYNDRPTKYMRHLPGLKEKSWKIIDQGFKEDGIQSPDREQFKAEHFDPLWMTDREIESNRLMSEFIDDLDQLGGYRKYRKYNLKNWHFNQKI
jgi:hypothetical protein